jgi:heme/copper-type cytochrome/quinol oxidase subunit 3
MNNQRFIISVIAVFAFMFAYEFVVHGHLMMPMYMESQQLWRPDETMKELFPWSLGIGLALAAAITYLFTRHYEGKGTQEGVRFGLYIGLIMGLVQAGTYIYLPISLNLAIAWFVLYVIEGIGAGIVLSLTYKS